ncbi:capsular associated protein [Colletotrichum musicola]|uniref:Capsular associated protein n=1 Tax=Colletotrichum musicola TaxID=2175873 RepID=A0A8H6U8J2_9PEZI|nr:capsular associated protein [Colletotrichum musicola]
MAAPLKRHGNLAACIVLLACTAWLSSRFNNSAAFERPIHFTIVTLLESGLVIAAWARWKSPWKASHNEGFQLAAFTSSRPDWQRWFQTGLNAIRNPVFLLSPSLVLGCAIVLRTLLFWRTVRTIHCSWESFETFLPALIALYTIAAPTTITIGDQNQRSSRRCFDTSHVRYLLLAIAWACAARATLALSTQPAGAICPPGFFRWETQIPVAQAVTVVLDALLVVYLSKWRQDTAEDPPQAWGFASRLFLGSAAALGVLACFSFYNLRNLRWAFALHYVAVRDMAVDGTAASIAILCGFYLMTDLHPSTLAMITTAVGVYAHQIVRVVKAAPVDGSWLYVISGAITVVGVGLLLRYDKDISAAHNGEQRLMRFLTGLYVVLVGVLCGAYLIFYPDFSADGLSFPDHLSAEYAKSQDWMARAHKSANLSEAVEAYRHRYMVSPPPNFDKWYEYAVENGSPIIDDFNQITHDLLPFWGLSPRVLRERTRHALEYPWLGMGGIRIRGGKAAVAPGTPGSHRWMMESMQRMIEPFAQHLPDMDLAMNLNDECRVSIPHEKVQSLARDAFSARARNEHHEGLKGFDGSKTPAWGDEDKFRSIKVKSPYFADRIRDEIYYDYVAAACRPDSPARTTRWWSRKEACSDCVLPHTVRVYENALENHPVVSNWSAATDLCHQPDMAYLNGFLMSPAAAVFTTEAFPVFSQSKTSGFNDILVPSPWNFDDKAAYDETEDVVEFEKKENVMFWRGSPTDGYAARGSWQGFLRARFVKVANAFHGVMPDGARQGGKQVVAPRIGADATPSFDVGFVGEWNKCHQADCQAERDTFPSKDPVLFRDHWRYRHLMDLDGAGFSGRFIPFLRSRSLVYRTGVFRTWLAERVHAWRHYVPVDVRLHELRGLLWYFGADYEGRIQAGKIADEGREWAARALRKEDMRIYMFRLLLEWGRLVDDERESLGFAL